MLLNNKALPRWPQQHLPCQMREWSKRKPRLKNKQNRFMKKNNNKVKNKNTKTKLLKLRKRQLSKLNRFTINKWKVRTLSSQLKALLQRKVDSVVFLIKPLQTNSNFPQPRKRNNLKRISQRLKLKTRLSKKWALQHKRLKSIRKLSKSLPPLTNNTTKENLLNKNRSI